MDAPRHAPDTRHFLFLQGPHGPFFGHLARHLSDMGARVSRVGFNRGDRVFWRGLPGFHAYAGPAQDWPDWIARRLGEAGVTDIVLYGSTRPVHAAARTAALGLGITVHVFEEGYLRPYWATYERGAANGGSPLARMSIDEMRSRLSALDAPLRRAPDRWGDMRAHMFWGAVYHALLITGQSSWPGYRPHRTPAPAGEFWLYLQHLLKTPLRHVHRWAATRRVRTSPFPYHVALLQLAHDANFRDHSDFDSQEAFLRLVMEGFARGAPSHHRLVLKAHPLEDGREPLPPLIARLARETGLKGRVIYLTGGKLARLLDGAESAVTVNSTSAEQALWRNLPLKAFGRAIYNRPELVSSQPLPAFFAAPDGPDPEAYAIYRRFLLATSQVPGGYYARAGRRRLLKRLPDMMLSLAGPYDLSLESAAAGAQHLRIVR